MTVFQVSEVYRKVGEVGAVNLHQVSSKSKQFQGHYRKLPYKELPIKSLKRALQGDLINDFQALFRVSLGSL